MDKKFEYFEHFADIGITAFGKNLEILFENSVEALINYIYPDYYLQEERYFINIEINSIDIETTLIKLINEILYLMDIKRILPLYYHSNFVITNESNVYINGVCVFSDFPENALNLIEVKAATFGELKFEHSNDLYSIRFIIDV